MHHAETLITDEGRIRTKNETVRVALVTCGYAEGALKEGRQLGMREKRSEEDADLETRCKGHTGEI